MLEHSLRAVAERRGWQIVETYNDAGISGAKGRDKRPGLDAMLKNASRRRFDVVMAWAIDRLGRSLIDLLGTIAISRRPVSVPTSSNKPSTPQRRRASRYFKLAVRSPSSKDR